MADVRLPQLRMWVPLSARPATPPAPEGCVTARLAKEAVADWVSVLNSTGELGVWTAERARKVMAPGGASRVLEEGVRVVYCHGVPVATACLTVQANGPEAELGWVAVHPDHRRRGLGRLVCATVLDDMARRSYERAFLLTDDHRHAAIRLYWSMGFRPELTDESHSRRWQVLAEQLGLSPGADRD